MRCAILQVHPYVVVELCKGGLRDLHLIRNAVPKDAEIIDVAIGDKGGMQHFSIVLESESFKDVEDLDSAPILPLPIFTIEN